MIISVTSPDGPRLEFPPGHVIYQQKAGWFGHPRFSPDGSMIAFENHSIAGNDDGQVDLLDANGKHSVIFKSSSVEGLAWSPDGKELWFAATQTGGWAEQDGWNAYRQMVASGAPILLMANVWDSYPALSPDGELAALRKQHDGIYLCSGNGSQPVKLKAASDDEFPIRFADGGKSLLVADPTGRELVVTLINLASGRRQLWKRFDSETRADQTFVATPDLKYYAYPFPRYSSVLYTVENLH